MDRLFAEDRWCLLLLLRLLHQNQPASSRTRSVLTTLPEFSADYYPNVHVLLRMFVVLPVFVAECERSFSTLKGLKTYLRSITGQERVVGLALMSIHRDVVLTPEELAQEFMQQPKRVVVG